MIGDRHTAALVGKNGSVDWLCLPRFDSAACFAALFGDDEHGRWQLCPVGDYEVSRAYVENSAALQTTFTTETGVVTLLDVMPTGDDRIDLVRRVTGVRGTVRMHHEWIVRFDYGTGKAVGTPSPRRHRRARDHGRGRPRQAGAPRSAAAATATTTATWTTSTSATARSSRSR